MTFQNAFRLAKYYLFANLKKTFSLFFNIFLICSILMIWLNLSQAITNAYDFTTMGQADNRIVEDYLALDDEGEIIQDEKYDFIMQLSEQPNFYSPVLYQQPDLVRYLKKEEQWKFVNLKFASITLNGENYHLNGSVYRENSKQAYALSITEIYGDEILSQNNVIRYQYENPSKNYLLAGKMELQDGELLISNAYLSAFCPNVPYDSIIGKSISVQVEDTILLNSYTVAGVFDEHVFTNDTQILVRGTPQLNQEFDIHNAVAKISMKRFSDMYDSLDYLEKNGVAVGDFVYLFVDDFFKIDSVKLIIERIVVVFGALILLSLLVKSFHIFLENIWEHSDLYGMQKALGMNDSAIAKVESIKIALLTITAVICSSVLSYGFICFTDSMLFSFLQVHLQIAPLQYLKISLIGAVAVCLTVFAIDFVVLKLYLRKQPVELLKSGKK